MVSFNLLEKTAYPEAPPRVEYNLTQFDQRSTIILDAIAQLQRGLDASEKPLK